MPKKVVSFFPRRKEGEEPDGRPTRRISVSYEDLEALFHLPVKDAAREMNLCATTFKKACRSFGLEEWPFRKGRIAQTEPVYPPTPPTLQTSGMHPASRAVMVSCTSPVWLDGSSERRETSSFGFPHSNSSVASSSSNVRASAGPSRDGLDPVNTVWSGPMALATRSYGEARHASQGETRHAGQSLPVLSSAAQQGLLQQASKALDTRSYGEARRAGLSLPGFSSAAPQGFLQQASMAFDTRSYARHAGPAFPVFAIAAPQGLLHQASMARDTQSFTGVPLPMSEGLPTTRPLGEAHGGPLLLEPGPPRDVGSVGRMGTPTPTIGVGDPMLPTLPTRELSCVEAVMDYLERPPVGDFEFMFADEGASLDGDDDGAE